MVAARGQERTGKSESSVVGRRARQMRVCYCAASAGDQHHTVLQESGGVAIACEVGCSGVTKVPLTP